MIHIIFPPNQKFLVIRCRYNSDVIIDISIGYDNLYCENNKQICPYKALAYNISFFNPIDHLSWKYFLQHCYSAPAFCRLSGNRLNFHFGYGDSIFSLWPIECLPRLFNILKTYRRYFIRIFSRRKCRILLYIFAN